MNDIQKIDWIEQYLKGELEEKEKARFEATYHTNPEFAREVDLHREIREVAGDKRTLELSRHVRTMLQKADVVSEVSSKKRHIQTLSFRFFFAIAAAITLIIATVYWFVSSPSDQPAVPIANQLPSIQDQTLKPDVSDTLATPSSEKPGKQITSVPGKNFLALVEAYYRSPAFTPPEVRRGEADRIPHPIIQQAYEKYSEALKFKDAAPRQSSELLREVVLLLTSPPDSISLMAHYLRAHARYQLREFEAAASDFQIVYSTENPQSIDAKWYGALCFLSMEGRKNAQAKQLLREIAEGKPSDYMNRARELLAKIQSQ